MEKHRLKTAPCTPSRLQSGAGQLAVALLPVFLFFGTAIRATRHRSMSEPAAAWYTFLALAAVLAASGTLWLVLAVRSGWRPAAWLKRWAPFGLILCIMLLLRLPQWGTLPTDDAREYYLRMSEACYYFDYTFHSWFIGFRLASHPTWGYASLMAIAQWLIPGDYNSVWLCNTAMEAVSALCVYDMLRRGTRAGTAGAFWGTLTFTCGSMFLGLNTFFQPDFACAMIILWIMWAFLRRQHLLLIGALILEATSKEIGITLVAGFFVGSFLYEWCHAQATGFWRRTLKTFCQPRLLVMEVGGLAAGIALLYYVFASGLAWGGSAVMEGSSYMAHFGTELSYLLYKPLQAIVCNFTWLMLLVGGVTLLLRKKRPGAAGTEPSAVGSLCAGATGAIAVFYLVTGFVVTITLERYNFPVEVLVEFMVVALLCDTFAGKTRAAVCGVLALLLGTQAYLTIDPLMRALYAPVNTDGLTPLVCTQEFAWDRDPDYGYVDSTVIYNYQHAYLTRGSRDVLAVAGMDAETSIVTIGPYINMYVFSNDMYGWEPGKNDITDRFGPETLYLKATQTYSRGTNSTLETVRARGQLKPKAIFVWVPHTFANDTPEAARAGEIPSYYKNIRQHRLNYWPYGAITYFTADYAE